MSAIAFASRSPESLFVVLARVAAETPAGYRLVLESVHLDNDSAERVAVRAEGSKEVREIPFNVGYGGSPLWGWANVYTPRYGEFSKNVAEAIGVGYGDRALLPDFSAAEWTRYLILATQAGQNPLAHEFARRAADMQKFTTDTGRAKKLFAVVSPNHDLVAVFDPTTNIHEVRTLFRMAVANNPELGDHKLRELYAGMDNPWGEYLTVSVDLDIVEELLGKHPDRTVFIIPGEPDEYTLYGSKLLTESGDEADIIGLVRMGLRLRTAEDVRAGAYATMERLVAEARSERT